MPNIKSAIKRVKVTEKKNLRNKAVKSEISTFIKKFNAAINANDPAAAEAMLPQVFSAIRVLLSIVAAITSFPLLRSDSFLASADFLLAALFLCKTSLDTALSIAEKKAKEEQERLEARKAREEMRAQKAAEKEKEAKTSKKTKKADKEEVKAEVKTEEKAAAPKKAKKTETEKTE